MKKEDNTTKCPICGRPLYKDSKYCIFHASAEEKTEDEFKDRLKEYIQEIKEEDKDYNFERFIFIEKINFKKNLDVSTFINANFTEATFEGDALFSGITFKGATGFSRTTFKGLTSFVKAIFEREASFSGITFEGVSGFQEATFKRRTSFVKATFKGDAFFSGITFKGEASFVKAIFEGEASFNGTTFEGEASFSGTTFEGEVSFEKAIFKGFAGTKESLKELYNKFQNEINKILLGLEKQNLAKGTVNFWKATFKQYANFKGATFGNVDMQYLIELAKLSKSEIYKENINSWKKIFKQYVNFSGVTFEGDAEFKLKYLESIIDFSEIRVFSGKNLSIHVINGKGNITFERAYLENIYLDIKLVGGVFIDFTNTLLRNTKIVKDQIKNHILHEEKKEFSKAQEIYLLLKNNFHSIGRYEDESRAFIKEKEMERKSICHIKTLHKWLWSCFLNVIYGYGEKPERVLLSAILIILIFACVFMNCGITSNPLDNLPKYNILKELSTGILYGDLLNKCKAIPREQVIKSLYFSTVTFTTLGLGDFTPVDNKGRIYVGLEAFTGAFMMALFVYTFARRTGGR